MAIYGFVAFCAYIALFYMGQITIGNIRHVRRLKAREAPGKLILVCVAMILMPFVALTMKHERPYPAIMATGAAITLLGFGLSMWAQWELGRYWVGGIGLHKDHRLITSGPYRLVRHPLYTGMLISAFGLSIFGLDVIYALMVWSFSGGFAIRSIGEEYELKKKFKKQYPAYEAATGMLFPRFRKRG